MSPIEPPPCVWELPDPGHADEDGIAGIGADLLPGTVLAAYRAGLFPMPLGGRRRPGPLGWWSPDPRGIIPLDGLRISRSLRRSCARYEVRVDTAFEAVIDACAEPNRPGGWITPEIRNAYVALHRLGWAHSVETWTIEEAATRPAVTESGARAAARPDAPIAKRPTVAGSDVTASDITASDITASDITASDVVESDVAASTVDGGRPELSESKNLRDAGGRSQRAEDDGAGERPGGVRLVGGLYGVAIGGLFAGESMFHSATDASKVALVALVDMLREDGNDGAGRLFDVQWVTDHLATLGAVEISRGEYLRRLERALPLPLPSRLLATARRA